MAVDLITNIILNGTTTAGFENLGRRLQTMGGLVDQIGGKVREFEKESVNVYKDYEDNMLAAEFALSATYKSSTRLQKVMGGLEDAAQQWASTTIFHTDDVAAAINVAAHAGWDYEQIIIGIPAAMKLAQAGGMDLSQGLDYLVKVLNTTGTEFDGAEGLIDQWAMAANRSATDIEEMGEAFLSLSSTAMFADNTQELFTMLAVLANAGVTGSKAGTMLRTAMMRVVAPTKAAKEAMMDLGATEEELAEWDTVDDTAAQLQELGFSAYDAKGNLLPMMDIFTSLHDSLQFMDEQSRYDILSKIFPLRSISAATAFYNAIEKGNMAELFAAIGDSEGYAAEGADLMTSGLTGSLEKLYSKWEQFELLIGETLAPAIESIAGLLGSIIDGINGMDEAQLGAVAGALTVIAEAGPALMTAGMAIKVFAVLGPWGTLAAAAAVGMGALVGYMIELRNMTLKDSFGTMTLNLSELSGYVEGLTTEFTTQKEAVAVWEQGLAQAQETYANTTSEFAEMLLTDVLTGKELTDADKEKLETYASEIYASVIAGINNAKNQDLTFFDILFAQPVTGEDTETGNMVGQMVSGYYTGLYAEAEKIGEELRRKMVAALADNELNETERQAIQSTIDRLNEIQSQIANAANTEAYYTQLRRGQSVSWDTISTFLTDNAAKQAESLEEVSSQYDIYYGRLRAAFDFAKENGMTFKDLEGNEYQITDENADELWGRIEEQFNAQEEEALQSERERWGNVSATAFDALMNDSAMGDTWKWMKGALSSGGLSFDESGFLDTSAMDWSQYTRDELMGMLDETQKAIFASGPLLSILEPFQDVPEVAEWMQIIRAMSGLSESLNTELLTRPSVEQQAPTLEEQMESQLGEGNSDYLMSEYARLYDLLGNAYAEGGLAGFQGLESEIAEFEQINDLMDRIENAEVPWTESADLPDWYGEYMQQKASIEANPPQLDVTATLDTSAIDNWEPQPKYMDVYTRTTSGGGGGTNRLKPYAEGGRTDIPSIFGDDGPEWAIPEEHTQRTADLLDMARRASGFTWGDLLARNGGLNAGGGSVTVNYSPTINAGDAQGVADVLARDKDRLLRLVRNMMAEQRLRDEVAAFV